MRMRYSILLAFLLLPLGSAPLLAQNHSKWIVDGNLEESPFVFPFEIQEIRTVNKGEKREIWHITSLEYDDVYNILKEGWDKQETIGDGYMVMGISFLYHSQTHFVNVGKDGMRWLLELRTGEQGGTLIVLLDGTRGKIQAKKVEFSPYRIKNIGELTTPRWD